MPIPAFISIKTLVYQLLIDPILSRLHRNILVHVNRGEKVIDIACGTGALAIEIAGKAGSVTAIDIDTEGIDAAVRTARRIGLANVSFKVLDASDLSCFADKSFDTAVTSMAIHQFDYELALKILREMKRIAGRVIIADYNYPMPQGWGRRIARGIERIAGGDHYRNFRVYMNKGGIPHFTEKAGLTVKSEAVRGSGVFVVVMCD
jgi:SAM-dependent methyltransferase